jgi:hypothetical protein
MPRKGLGYAGAGCALVVSLVAGCSLVAPLGGLTGGVESGFTGEEAGTQGDGPSSEGSGPGEPDGPNTRPGDDATSAPPSDASSATPDAGATEGGAPGDDAGTGGGQDSAVVDAPPPPPPPPPPPIAFVQVAVNTTSGTASSFSATYSNAQAQGDLNVIAIGWNDTTSSVTAVHDSAGNTYSLAVGPTRYAPDLSQAIYYAPNIAAGGAGANKVTVDFDAAANSIDLRILEYSGLSKSSPLDVTSGQAGTGSGALSSGKATTTSSRELLVGAGMTTDIFASSGPGYTERAITTLGDLVEDRIVSSTGSYSADAPDNASTEYVLQLATFR